MIVVFANIDLRTLSDKEGTLNVPRGTFNGHSHVLCRSHEEVKP